MVFENRILEFSLGFCVASEMQRSDLFYLSVTQSGVHACCFPRFERRKETAQ